MINFMNILQSIEKLAIEIFMWVIFIPKTIGKVVMEVGKMKSSYLVGRVYVVKAFGRKGYFQMDYI